MPNRLIICDANNLFMRSYIVSGYLSTNGVPISGIVGTLLSISKFIREINPQKVVIVWDGRNGSQKRKKSNSSYKSNRKLPKLNWNSNIFNNDEEILENQFLQMIQLYQLIDLLPFHQFMIENSEADDVISYVAQMSTFQDWQKVIISSDKDFIQLLNEKTIIFRPTQKEILNTKKVIEEVKIHPNNFLLARSICGDSSDNLKGVDGAGLPTISKRFPFLLESKQYLIPDIIKTCEYEIQENKSKLKIYKNILDNRDKIELNYNLMQLVIPKVGLEDCRIIQQEMKKEKLTFQKTEFIGMMNKVGFNISLDVFSNFNNNLMFK